MNLHDAIAHDQQAEAERKRLAWWRFFDEDPEGLLEAHYLMTGKRDPWRLLAAIVERAAFWARERRYLN